MKVGFIIPVKSKEVSSNWEIEIALLNRTLQSICGQTCQNFEVFVIHNEKPEVSFVHKNIHFIKFPYETLSIDQISDYNEYGCKYYDPVFAVKIMDKIRKVAFGGYHAKRTGCRYLMNVDSDDLISNKLVAYINSFKDDRAAGWYITTGYIYKEGSSLLVKQAKNMEMLNGSTHIVRDDFFKVPDFSSHAMWNYSFFESHGYLKTRVRDFFKEELQPIPFAAVVYVVHQNNWSAVRRLVKIDSVQRIIKQLLYFQWLTSSVKKEFGIYHL